MAKRTVVQRGAYFDSVKLMLVTRNLSTMPGVTDVSVVMGTDLNKDTLERTGLATDESRTATQTDLIVAAEAETDEQLDAVFASLAEQLEARAAADDAAGYKPRSMDAAFAQRPETNLVVVSVPGAAAKPLVMDAVAHGAHVMLFSDNVTVEDELAMKQAAQARGVMVMGPDCGTAMINGVPLCFANKVRRGDIGMVSASGTGSQEVMVCIHKRGGGISQAIGTGGRDLKDAIGGITFFQGLEALEADPETKVITLVSKPPAPAVAERVTAFLAEKTTKPVVVHFVGGEIPADSDPRIVYTASLEECAARAVEAAGGATWEAPADDEVATQAGEIARAFPNHGKTLRGLFAGGTLAFEANHIAGQRLGAEIDTNLFTGEAVEEAANPNHFVIDFGDDAYTKGRPHPMIDSRLRAESFEKHLLDPATGVILMDVVLGYGAEPTPDAAFLDLLAKHGAKVPVVVYVCGVEEDPQGYSRVRDAFTNAGAFVAPSNRAAAELACAVLTTEEGK